MSARNLKALAISQALREEIRQHLLARHPCAKPLTAKELASMLTRPVSPSTIAWHLRAIWAAHALQTNQPNSTATSDNLSVLGKRIDNGSEADTA